VKVKNRRTSVALVVLLAVSKAIAGELPWGQPKDLGFSSERLTYIDQFYDEKVKSGELAGIVTLIARHGKIVHFSAIGYADVVSKQKMETDTIFRLYSMTKPIASVALMMLYQEGRFQMSDPVSKYIPEFADLRVLRTPDAAIDDTVPLDRPPNIEDLMRHTGGFMHGGKQNAVDRAYLQADVFGVDVSLAQMVSRLSKIPLAYQPGTKFAYSVGPDIQARLVEILSGLPFDEFLAKRLFAPLGMKDTGFWLDANKARRLASVSWEKDGKLTPLDTVHGYPKEDGVLAEPWSVNSYTVDHKRKGGSFGLVGTAEDYWRFAELMAHEGEFNGIRILSPWVAHYMTCDHMGSISMVRQNGRPSGYGFGLGFAIEKDPAGGGYMGSQGTYFWAGAANTHFWIDPKEEIVVVALAQHMGTPKLAPLWGELRTLVYSALLN
jgi:CubicO group peptidase (beta-lactamase class C family)